VPRAYTFWQLPEEEPEFLGFLNSTGNVIAFPDYGVVSPDERKPTPLEDYLRKCSSPYHFLFGLERFADRICGKYSTKFLAREGHGHHHTDVFSSWVMGYSGAQLRDLNKLSKSNLFTYFTARKTGDPDDDAKKAEFKRWVNKVFAYAKKRSPESVELHSHFYPATKKAKEAAVSENIQLTV
jgi:hypothetical protein